MSFLRAMFPHVFKIGTWTFYVSFQEHIIFPIETETDEQTKITFDARNTFYICKYLYFSTVTEDPTLCIITSMKSNGLLFC